MRSWTPIPPSEREPLLEFKPVPRRPRQDGWTPERQRAFIAALADTGCARWAAAMVNIAQTNCYELRRAPGAEGFRRAWDAVLNFRAQPVRDAAFERAMKGQLVPVFAGGKLMGYRRKKDDALLTYILRHYGEDANGKRITIDYFSPRARAGAPLAGGDGTARDAEAAPPDGLEGVPLDAEAQAAIAAALQACAARAQANPPSSGSAPTPRRGPGSPKAATGGSAPSRQASVRP